MNDIIVFEAELFNGNAEGVGFYVPFDVYKVFGTKGQVKVKVTIDGYPHRGLIAPMGKGVHAIVVKKAIREIIGKNVGNKVYITLQKDTEPRIVDIPEDLDEALNKNKIAKENFNKFSFTCQKEYAQWITEAKKEETRTRRLEKAIEMISQGKKFS
jgi:acetylornithine deacetylase/succinyl-diaminopimelate desuccinylase-like protein